MARREYPACSSFSGSSANDRQLLFGEIAYVVGYSLHLPRPTGLFVQSLNAEPHWRLAGASGQSAKCYLDAVSGNWMVVVWRDGELFLREEHASHESAQERSDEIRSEMIADGWVDSDEQQPPLHHGPQTAWLFTRGRESVRLEVRDSEQGVQLAVCGPGTKRTIYDYPDTLALLVHQAEIERHLAGMGFFLEKFITDRRRYPR